MVLSQEEMVLYTRGNGALYKRKWCFIQEEMVLYVLYKPCVAIVSARLKALKALKDIKSPRASKIKGYGTRFARVVSRAKAKSKALIMHSLCSCFFKSKSINTSLADTR